MAQKRFNDPSQLDLFAEALYPDADIRSQAFEDVTLPTNRFDLALSNVPVTAC